MSVCSSVVKTVVPDFSNGDCVKLCSEHYRLPKDGNNQVYRHLPPNTDTVQTKPFPIRGKVTNKNLFSRGRKKTVLA